MPSFLKKILKKYHFHPLKRLGQNFLIDKKIIKAVVEEANIQKKDIVLEIGPGLGALTKEIIQRAGKVIAVEKDERMTEIIKKELEGCKNLRIVQGDIMKISDLSYLLHGSSKYKVVANLPFYAASPVIRKLLEFKNPPKEMVLIVQKEIAKRICSKPPQMNVLAVFTQFYADPKIIMTVSKKSFWPMPKVDGAIIRIKPLKKNRAKNSLFFEAVKAGFSHPRKKLVSNLARELAMNPSNKLKLNKEKLSFVFRESGIDLSQRAEALKIENWIKLVKMLK